MPRYIDAERLIQSIQFISDMCPNDNIRFVCADIATLVEEQPTADVKEVKHGHWNKTCVPDVYQCDVCKKPVKMDEFCGSEILREFCPKCGADMRGEEK